MASEGFTYYQPNYKDIKDESDDCVVRAICKALNINWITAFDLLCGEAREIQFMPSSKKTYESLLRKNGFEYHGISNKKGTKRPTVKFMTTQSGGSIIVMNVANHVVTAVDGKFYDIWDSGNKSLYGYWIKDLK